MTLHHGTRPTERTAERMGTLEADVALRRWTNLTSVVTAGGAIDGQVSPVGA